VEESFCIYLHLAEGLILLLNKGLLLCKAKSVLSLQKLILSGLKLLGQSLPSLFKLSCLLGDLILKSLIPTLQLLNERKLRSIFSSQTIYQLSLLPYLL